MNRNTMSMLSDIYRLHQLVMSGFREYDHSTRVLFRLEPEIRGNISKLLIQSQVKPIWGPIGDKEKGIVMSGMKEFNPQFLEEPLTDLGFVPTPSSQEKANGMV